MIRIAFVVVLWSLGGGFALAAPAPDAGAASGFAVNHVSADSDSSGGMACSRCASACPAGGCALSASMPFGVLRSADLVSMAAPLLLVGRARAPETAPPKRISA